MNEDLCRARQLLERGGCTCVLCCSERVYSSAARGIRPLLELLDRGNWAGFSAADNVVGKAAAFLYVLMKIRALYAPVISEAALQVLQSSGIDVHYRQVVPAILNRRKTGFCPMENAVRQFDDPQAALSAIRRTYAQLNT